VWEDKPEDVEELLRQNLPVLTEVPELRILSKEEGKKAEKTGLANQEGKEAKGSNQATLDFAPATNRFTSSTL